MEKHKIKFFQAGNGESSLDVEEKVNAWLAERDMEKTQILSVKPSQSMTALPDGTPFLVFMVMVHYAEAVADAQKKHK